MGKREREREKRIKCPLVELFCFWLINTADDGCRGKYSKVYGKLLQWTRERETK